MNARIVLPVKNCLRKLTLISFTLLALFCGVVSVKAQENQSPQRGFTPAGSYALTDIETINTTNGNLMLHIPLAALPPGRGGSPGAQVGLLYNSKLWDTRNEEAFDIDNVPFTRSRLISNPYGGWYRTVPFGLQYQLDLSVSDGSPNGCPDPLSVYNYRLSMIFPDGGAHEFRPQGYTEHLNTGLYNISPGGVLTTCNGMVFVTTIVTNTLTYYSTDGSFLRLDIEHDNDPFNWQNNPWTLYFPDGSRVTGGNAPQRRYDRNNNYVEFQNITNNGHPATQIVDQLGRSLIVEYGASTNSDNVYMRGVNNELLTWTIKWKFIQVRKTYYGTLGTTDPLGLAADIYVIDQIILPSQAGALAYIFGYNASTTNPSNGWGELTSVTLPSGAQTNYHYFRDGANFLFAEYVPMNYANRKDLTYLLEYDGSSTATTEGWDYVFDQQVGYTETRITDPAGGITKERFVSLDSGWDSGLVYKSEQSDGTVIERIWQANIPYGARDGYGTLINMNPYVKTEFTSLRDSGGTLVKTAIKDFSYDKNGNVTQVAEYDWVAYGSVPRDSNNKPAGIPTGQTPQRIAVNTYYSPTPDATNTTTDNADVYHKPTSPRLKRAAESSEARDGANQAFSRAEMFYDDPREKGNLTQQKVWDSWKGGVNRPITRPLTSTNSVSVSHQYDGFGNRTLSTDERGNQTQLTYGPINGFSDLYPTETRTAFNTPVQRISSQTYDFYTGLAIQTTDVDNNLSTRTTYDVFGRPTLVQENYQIPQSALEKRTSTEYSDTARRVIVRADLNSTGDGKLVSIQHYDQLGRVRLSRRLEDAATQNAYDETIGIKGQTRYRIASSNSYELVSNPYRASSSGGAGAETTMGWARTKRDIGGRVIEVQTYSGTALPAPWGTSTSTTGAVITVYDGIYTTVTDQTGKVRRSVVDGLGRVARVDEPQSGTNLGSPTAPLQATSYGYTPLGNLTQVTQGTQPSRNFQYTSQSRLKSAQNPESGTVNYEYDDNGNLSKKTDARGVQTLYAYDALNRVTSRNYANDPQTTPAVFYYYDNQTLPAGAPSFTRGPAIGRLVATLYGGSTSSTGSYQGYDVLGRAAVSAQKTDAASYSFGYSYNLAGGMISETYPSGRVVTTGYDAAGRISAVNGQKTGEANKTYTSGYTYTAHGAVAAMGLSVTGSVAAMTEQWSYNSRLQPTQMELRKVAGNTVILGLDYGYGVMSQNNSNLSSQTIRVGSSTVATQTYTYDHLNRLNTVNETNTVASWQQTYDCDRYGSRAVRVGSYIPTPRQTPTSNSPSDLPALFNQANNRIIASSDYAYDQAGNLTSMPDAVLIAADTMAYDAENRQASYTKASATTLYGYDGNGRRVKKVDGSGTTVFVYDIGGRLIAEYHSVPVPGGGGTSYVAADYLESTRVVTKADGTVKARYDYLPFGEEVGSDKRPVGIGYGGGDSTSQKFTQKERDSESGLDYFGARYYSSPQGRFTSADPNPVTKENFVNPQRWNLYIYVNNNPLAAIDPNGEDGEGKGGDKVISVFLEFGLNDRNYVDKRSGRVYESGPNWQQSSTLAANNGYRLDLFGPPSVGIRPGLPNLGSASDFENALKNSDVVLYIGHGRGTTALIGGRELFVQNSIAVDPWTAYGEVGRFIPQSMQSLTDPESWSYVVTGGRPASSAGVFCNFSCNSAVAPNYLNSGVQIQVTIDGGPEGLTNVGTLEKAAKAFVDAYVKTNGTTKEKVDAGIEAANAEIARSKLDKDKGDKAKGKLVLPYLHLPF